MLALAAAALPHPAAAGPLDLDWCTGVSPISWGFSVTPATPASEVKLKPLSSGVNVLTAAGGPLLPEGWTVSLGADRSVVASGPTPLPAGVEVPAFFVLETDRAAASISARGVMPVKWELQCGGAPSTHSFTPVLELSDAVSRGLVIASARALSPNGLAEVTVDNPTFEPLMLDLPPGTLLRAGERDWVLPLATPFDMMRKQKTGRTLFAFPVTPEDPGSAPPRRMAITGKRHAEAGRLEEISLAVRTLAYERRSASGLGEFEYWMPFDFWPIVLQWAFWTETSAPPRVVLLEVVQDVLSTRAAAGDTRAAGIDPLAAAQEIEKVLPLVSAGRQTVVAAKLPVAVQASRARFRK